MNTQNGFPLGWTGWISLKPKGLSRVFSNTLNTEVVSQAPSDFQFLFVEIKPILMKYSRVILDDVVVVQLRTF